MSAVGINFDNLFVYLYACLLLANSKIFNYFGRRLIITIIDFYSTGYKKKKKYSKGLTDHNKKYNFRLFHGWWARTIFIPNLCQTNERIEWVCFTQRANKNRTSQPWNNLFIICLRSFNRTQRLRYLYSLLKESNARSSWLTVRRLYRNGSLVEYFTSKLSSKNTVKRQN